MMDILIAILGSSSIATIVTAVVTMIQNRKNNSISYITEERKIWREKIREIVVNIERSQYCGEGELDINTYLVQLQANINTYGMLNKYDYGRDGHIWEVVKNIQEANDELGFNSQKEILLKYISLMLKEDWERSKRELKGWHINMSIAALYILLFIVSTIYCFAILNVHAIWEYAIIQIVILAFWIIIKIYVYDEFMETISNGKILSLQKAKKEDSKYISTIIKFIALVLVYMYILYTLIFGVLVDIILDNTIYYEQEDTLELYVNGIDEIYLYDLKENIEDICGKKVNIAVSDDDKEQIEEFNKYRGEINIDKEIEKEIKHQIGIPNAILYIFYIIYMMWCIFYVFSYDKKEKERQLKKEVVQIKYSMTDLYKQEVKEALTILTKIMERNVYNGNTYEGLLGLERNVLKKIESGLNSKFYRINSSIYTMREYENINNIKLAKDYINKALSEIKKLNKEKDDYKKKKILEKIQFYVQKVSDIGNVY